MRFWADKRRLRLRSRLTWLRAPLQGLELLGSGTQDLHHMSISLQRRQKRVLHL